MHSCLKNERFHVRLGTLLMKCTKLDETTKEEKSQNMPCPKYLFFRVPQWGNAKETAKPPRALTSGFPCTYPATFYRKSETVAEFK